MEPCMHEFQLPCAQRQTRNLRCGFLILKELPCGHTQQLPCSSSSDPLPCKAEVQLELPCSHFAAIPCGLSQMQLASCMISCKVQVRKKLLCGHLKSMQCHTDPFEMDCGLMDERTLECGHVYSFICPGRSMEDVVFLCDSLVNRRLACGHFQKGMCSRPSERCNQQVTRHLECGHSVETSCWNKSPTCLTKVDKMLVCGHMQPVVCCDGIDSVICHEQVEVLHPLCSHILMAPCFIAKDEFQLRILKCKAEPLKMLNCGHEIRLPCVQEIDETIVCTTMISYELPCHHMVTIPCGLSEEKCREKCKIKCSAPLDCTHYCSLTCHDIKVAHACNETVKKQLKCGHSKVTFIAQFIGSLY